MTISALTVLSLVAGCGGTAYQYKGHTVHEYFPLDGDRTWEYLQNDTSVPYTLEVEKLPNVADVDDWEIVTLQYAEQDPYEILYTVKWSSDSTDGVLIHGYATEAGASVDYDPPVTFGDYQMTSDDVAETETNGQTFSSTLIGVEKCPNHWTTDWECLHFDIQVEGGDTPPFVGEYWITTGWGVSWFRPSGFSDDWVLSYASWTPEPE